MRLIGPHDSAQIERDLPWRELAAGVGLTLGLHLLFLGIFILRNDSALEDDANRPQAMFIETELLQWGEVPPDETSLPTIANPRPATERPDTPEEQVPPPDETQEAPTDVVDLQAPTEMAAADIPTERRAEVREQKPDVDTARYRGENNPNRPSNDNAIEGFQDGFRGGTSLSPSAQRNLLARIQEQLQRAFSPPRSLSEEELRRLRIRIHVRIATDGQILGWDILESSGNRPFDTAATMTLNRFRNGVERLDMASISDASFRQFIEAEGLPIVMVGN